MKKIYKVRIISALIIFLYICTVFITAFYPIPAADFQFLPVFQRIITDFSVPAILILCFLIILTLIFGRLYCSLICPLGILQEIVCIISRKKYKYIPNNFIKYFIAAVTFGTVIGGTTLLIKFLEPYTYFGRAITLSLLGILSVLSVIILTFFKGRYFCTHICPVGTILGLISKISILKIYTDKENCVSCGLCEKNCRSSCINYSDKTTDNENCIKCLKCISICPKNALKYGIKPKEKISFDYNRRKFITAASAFIVLCAALKAGSEISKNTVKKIKNIILPPGGGNPRLFFNKCINCNICTKLCPTKILKKADNNFGAVHIEYGLNGYCRYDCNICSQVCPSGAIKRLSKEEKQNMRIAIAVINKEQCIRCGICQAKCPKHAIIKQDEKYAVDATKCIGCGICLASCPIDAVNIYSISEQRKI